MVLRRAWRDTIGGKVEAAILGIVGFAFAFGLYVQHLGWSKAMDEFQLWLISALGAAGSLFLLFVWNLACAPYRIERDKRLALETRLEAIEAGREGPGLQRDLVAERATRCREMLTNWREMARGIPRDDDPMSPHDYLRSSSHYASLRGHLSDDLRRRIERPERTFTVSADGALYPWYAERLLNEINEIERGWLAKGELG